MKAEEKQDGMESPSNEPTLTDELMAHALSDCDSDISPIAASIIRTLQEKLTHVAKPLCIGYYLVECVTRKVLAGPFRTRHESQVELATWELQHPNDRCVVLFAHRSDITWG